MSDILHYCLPNKLLIISSWQLPLRNTPTTKADKNPPLCFNIIIYGYIWTTSVVKVQMYLAKHCNSCSSIPSAKCQLTIRYDHLYLQGHPSLVCFISSYQVKILDAPIQIFDHLISTKIDVFHNQRFQPFRSLHLHLAMDHHIMGTSRIWSSTATGYL